MSSSSSFNGHGAKYWYEQYIALQKQACLLSPPHDGHDAAYWHTRYADSRKAYDQNYALYQAKISDLRTEVEDLRAKLAQQPGTAVLYKGYDAEYWWNMYQVAKDDASYFKEDAAKNYQRYTQGKETPQDSEAPSAPSSLPSKNLALVEGHDAVYWHDQYIESNWRSDVANRACDDLTAHSSDLESKIQQLQNENQLLNQKINSLTPKKPHFLLQLLKGVVGIWLVSFYLLFWLLIALFSDGYIKLSLLLLAFLLVGFILYHFESKLENWFSSLTLASRYTLDLVLVILVFAALLVILFLRYGFVPV
jgi:hypothetical protein